MSAKRVERNISTRRELFSLLRGQMQSTYADLRENQRLAYESSLIKSYVFEVNSPIGQLDNQYSTEWLEQVIGLNGNNRYKVDFLPTEEPGFFSLRVKVDNRELNLFLDSATDPRFWLGYTISESQPLDRWLEGVVRQSKAFDFIWLWPRFLESIQERGSFRGFGLDYDYRIFAENDTEETTYLKMQLWGSESTKDIYDILRKHPDFKDKVVLSKVRFKETSIGDTDQEIFAIQDVKYNGKFTARGTDLDVHLVTLNDVRSKYHKVITDIEGKYALKWEQSTQSGLVLGGYAIHFIPNAGHEIPVNLLVEKIFDGKEPFRLIGFPTSVNETSALVEVVDLHTGGKLTFDLHPDVLTVYLPEHTCGNSIARLYTNIQHTLSIPFEVEADNGDKLFN